MLSLLALALVASGCLEVQDRFTLNPDGSGRVVIDAKVKTLSFDDPKEGKKKQVNDFVAGVINKSSGVEVWKDITCSVLPDGRIQFKGTAYFGDLNMVEIKDVALNRYTFTTENGNVVVGIARKDKEATESEPGDDPATMTPEEIAVKIDSMKEQFRMGRGMMSMFVDELNEKSLFVMPTTVSQAPGFTRAADGAYGIEFSGKRVMKILDSLMESDAFWQKMVKEKGGTNPENEAEMMGLMFGSQEPHIVAGAGGQAAFDYRAEVNAAKKKYPALLKKFSVKEEVRIEEKEMEMETEY